MLDQILALVREQATQHIVNNTAVPNEHNEAAISASASAVEEGLKGALQGGDIKGLLGLLGGRGTANSTNPIVGNIVQTLTSQLSAKCGVTQSNAQSIATSIIPLVLQKMVGKINNPADSSMNINSVFQHISNGKSSGLDFQGLLGKLDQDGDGDLDINDVMGKLGLGQGAAGMVGKLAANLFGR